jgi:hypothetical protein
VGALVGMPLTHVPTGPASVNVERASAPYMASPAPAWLPITKNVTMQGNAYKIFLKKIFQYSKTIDYGERI